MRENHERHPRTRPIRAITHYIKQWRKHRHMTVEQVAAAAGLTASMISQLETGRSAFTQNSLDAVAAALQVDAGVLLLFDPTENTGYFYTTNYDALLKEITAEQRSKVEVLMQINADAAVEQARYLFGKPLPEPV